MFVALSDFSLGAVQTTDNVSIMRNSIKTLRLFQVLRRIIKQINEDSDDTRTQMSGVLKLSAAARQRPCP
ncbi:MAG: hypothetical protein ABSF03_12685, partial [Streptosporangiaceae bacterium]